MSEEKREIVKRDTFNPDDPASLFTQMSMFEQIQRAAMMLSRSSLVPSHLQGDGNISNCFLVIEQAMRWRMSPFAVAQSTYVLSGKLGYEGKLIAAIVNASPRLKTRLNYEFKGSGDDRSVLVSATLKGEDKPRTIEGSVRQWKTQRNPKWVEMQDQMLTYRGAREWARRHMPETVLGIYSDDELEYVAHADKQNVTVESSSLDDFLAPESSQASDDPKGNGGNKTNSFIVPVDAEVIEENPKAEKPKAQKAKAAPKSDEDKELNDLFG